MNGSNKRRTLCAKLCVLSVVAFCCILQSVQVGYSKNHVLVDSFAKKSPAAENSTDSEVTAENATASSPNRTLVVIIGNLRGGEVTWKTLYEHVLDVNRADLALVIGKVSQKNSSLYERAKFMYEFDEYQDWAMAVDTISSGNSSWREYAYGRTRKECATAFGPSKYGMGSSLINFMARYWLQKTVTKHNLLELYDRFVVTRSDHYYLCQHRLDELDNEFVWVPLGEDYGGVCDRHVVANSSMILKVLDVLPHFIRFPTNYPVQSRRWKCLNPERLLLWTWQDNGVFPYLKRFDRNMLTVRNTAVEDTSSRAGSLGNTNTSRGHLPPELAVKYDMEFYGANCTCFANNASYQYMWKKKYTGYCPTGPNPNIDSVRT